MVSQPPKQKGFLAKYWGLLLAGGLALGFVFLAALGAGAYFLLRSNVEANSIGFSMEKPVFGQPLTASVELENKGILSADYHAVLLVDGVEAATDDIDLKSKEPRTVSFELTGLAAGKHTASIGGQEVEFTVYRPAELTLTGFTVESQKLMVGEKVKVRATVKNSGDLPGEFNSPLTYDGSQLQAVKADVEPGEESVFETELVINDRGEHTLALEDKTQTITATAPAHIEVTGLTLSKIYPAPKEAITATVTVQNSGDLPGSYTVSLMVNGKEAQNKEVTVEANSSLDVAFKVAQSKAGRYSIKAGDYNQSMRVVVITRPKNGTLLLRKLKNGSNNMKIINNYGKDIIVSLANASKPRAAVISIYIRAKGTATLKKIPNGTYLFYFTMGSDYDSASKRFIKDPQYAKADNNYVFNPPRGYYQTWTVTMNASNGTGTNSGINESDFPQ